MAEYIEREAAIEAAKHSWEKNLEPSQYIEAIPAADVDPVRHGCTVPAEQPKKVLLDRKCGICDSLMLSTDVYCPNCGARMDGGAQK